MYGMEVYSEEGYKVFTTNGKIYYTLLGKCVARSLSVAKPILAQLPPGQRGWYIIFPTYITKNPDKYLLVMKITNKPVKLLDNTYTIARSTPPSAQLEFISATAPEVYVYTREPIQGSADYGLNTYNKAGELEFSSGSGNHVLQIEAAYQTVMSMHPTSRWTSGVMGNGVIIASLPIRLVYEGGEVGGDRVWEAELKLVNGKVTATLSSYVTIGSITKQKGNSRLNLSITKLPTWTVPTISW